MSIVRDGSIEAPSQALRDLARVSEGIQPPNFEIWCNWCGSLENLRRCGRCHRAFYCSKEHQKAHWRTHREECYERDRPEELQPSNDRDNFVTVPSSLANVEYTTNTSRGSKPAENKNPNKVSAPSELDSLLDATTFDTTQFVPISGLLPTSIEDNFNNIDLGLFLDENISDHSSWVKGSPNAFTSGTSTPCDLPDPSSFDVMAQGNQQFAELQSNSDIVTSYSQLANPPPYEFSKNSSYVAANLGSLDLNASNQENSNMLPRAIEPTSTNRVQIPQHFLYELADLSNTNNVSRESFSSDSAPLPESMITPEFLSRVCSNVVNDMNQFGICVIDNFLGKKTGESILAEVKELYNVGVFEEGQVVSSNHRTITKNIRGDRITWVDGKEENCRFVGFLIQTLDTIVTRCLKMKNSGLFGKCKINRRTKAMIACYPGNGTHYVKHVDNPNQDGRCITTIYYLNQAWDIQLHGGLLRMFPAGCDNQVANIEPLFDRILFFWSDRRNPHEVLPAFSVRFAITVWYCNADDRNKAIRRCGEELHKRKSEAQGVKEL